MRISNDTLAVLESALDAASPSGWGVPTEFEEDGWDVARYVRAYDNAQALLASIRNEQEQGA